MDKDPVLYCPHCGNRAPQRLVFKHNYEDTDLYGSDGSKEENLSLSCVYHVRVCATCNDLILYYESEVSELEVFYPASHSLHRSVPPAVRQAYEEAARVRNVSPAAYAVLLRRAMEAICEDRGIKDGSLQKRLAELSERGEIPPILSEATDMLRLIGNAGAHNSKERITVPMTWGMNELFKAVVEYVYVAPSRVEEFRASIKKRSEAQANTKS